MALIVWILLFCLLGGVLSVLAAALFLLFPSAMRARLLPHLISFATGALLGAALLALLPHALLDGRADPHLIGVTLLGGLLMFFLLEKMVLWRHFHYVGNGEADDDPAVVSESDGHGHHADGTLILIGDGLHNFVDGVLIAAAFLTDIHLGIVTALAVAAHEVPQEVGDFAILLNSGFSRARALAFNVLSSLATVVGGVLAWAALQEFEPVQPYVLAVAAASFLYVAVADLIPGLHRHTDLRSGASQIALILLGVAVIALAHSALH